MIICIKLVIILLIIYSLFFLVRAIICINKVKKEKSRRENKSSVKCNKNIIIAIPCLREQKCIEDTIKYFTEIAKDIPIIIVTTQKEVKENIKNDILTQYIIKNKILPKYKNVYLIDYPFTEGYMADQLNYMIEEIKNKIDLEHTYLALYNADSRPSERTFNEIKEKISEGHKVIQQYSYCLKNYKELNNILKGFSIYQSNFEMKTGLINSILNSKLLYTHVVGHGLIINMKTLNELGNFNTKFWCEDIYLGLQLKFNNIKITPLLTLENMETPSSLENLIKQNSVWFKTTSQFSKIYKDIIKNYKVTNKLNGLIGCFNEFRCALNWIGFPIILLLSIIGALILKNYLIVLLIIASYLLYICINTKMTIKLINILDEQDYKTSLKIIFFAAIATVISNIGPIYSIISNKKVKHKTER